jgi:hypothetical protein
MGASATVTVATTGTYSRHHLLALAVIANVVRAKGKGVEASGVAFGG